LEDGGEEDPEEVGDIGESNPLGARVDGEERPNECGEDEEYVEGGEEIVLQTELQGSEGEVEDEIERKRQSNLPW